ncbi:MAG: hypothetical protein HQK50_09615 [Oligoflexia bacterium]|nr:hypothetical protein [Oligoflexia bacterium]MBF0365819.1 hypothetical protein [Oligoflexia bacterium]
MFSLKIAGGVVGCILVIAGGVYLARKTKYGSEIVGSLKNLGNQVKSAFSEGYAEAVEN